MSDPVVELTWAEILHAGNWGFMQQLQNAKLGRHARYGGPDKDSDCIEALAVGVWGAVGEAAIAKWAGVYWNGNIGDLSARDLTGVGRVGVQVRTKPNRLSDMNLLLHPGDRDEDIFVLIGARPPQFRLAGWIYARDGKEREFWSDRPNGSGRGTGRFCFWIPERILRPMRELNFSCAKRAA
jgi:hypothetical protein